MARRSGFDEELFEPRNPLSFGEQLAEGTTQRNPLMMGRPSIYEQYSEPVTTPALEGVAPEIAAANPLLAPPRPIKYMPVEQQIIWQQMQAEALNRQASLQNTLNQNKLAARTADLEIKTRAQSGAILDAMDELDPASDDYDDKKSRLFQANPYGANSPEVQNIFKVKDAAWDLRKKHEDSQRQKILETQEALRKEAISQARKDAGEIGDPRLLEEVSRLSVDNPDAAIAQVGYAKNRIKEANLHAQLRQYGVPEEEIAQKYPDWRYADAAAARIKVEEARRAAGEKVASEAQTADIFSTLSKQKAEAASPTGKVEGKTWTPEQEALLQHYQGRLSIFATEPGRTAVPTTTTTPVAPAPALRGDELIRSRNEMALAREGATVIDPQTGRKMVKQPNGKWKFQ